MNHILELVTSYGYVIVFVAVFLDQASISVPSPPIVAAIGVLSASGRFNVWTALLVALLAACLADSLWYAIGTSPPNSRLISRLIPKKLKPKAASIPTFLARGMLGGLLSVKFSLCPSSIVPYFAGSTRFPARRFFLFQAVANFVWSSVFLFGGFLSADRSLQHLNTLIRVLKLY